jgi:hypothetical protein
MLAQQSLVPIGRGAVTPGGKRRTAKQTSNSQMLSFHVESSKLVVALVCMDVYFIRAGVAACKDQSQEIFIVAVM